MDAKIIRAGDVEEHESGRERIAKGQVIVHEQQAAVVLSDIEAGRKGAVLTTGVIRVRKVEGEPGFKHGDACDWKIAGRCITADGDFTLGAVIGDVGRADTVTDVALNGDVESKKKKPPMTPMDADLSEPVRPRTGMISKGPGENIEKSQETGIAG